MALAEEWFDVVSRTDQAVASAPRSYVHAQGLRHRSIHLFVTRPQGDKVYLQLRASTKDQHPGVWDTSCCGHVDQGELYEQAAWRELEEELGLIPAQVGELVPLFRVEARAETGQEFVQVYWTTTDEEPHPDPGEIQQGKWVGFSDLDDWLATSSWEFAPGFRYLWPRFREQRLVALLG